MLGKNNNISSKGNAKGVSYDIELLNFIEERDCLLVRKVIIKCAGTRLTMNARAFVR